MNGPEKPGQVTGLEGKVWFHLLRGALCTGTTAALELCLALQVSDLAGLCTP